MLKFSAENRLMSEGGRAEAPKARKDGESPMRRENQQANGGPPNGGGERALETVKGPDRNEERIERMVLQYQLSL